MTEGEALSVARARADAAMKALADAFVALAVPAEPSRST